MATIKSFTSLEQSKKLAEILTIESADMCYLTDITFGGKCRLLPKDGFACEDSLSNLPCWTLASLLDLLPNNEHISTNLSRGGWKIEPPEYVDKWWCEYEDDDHTRDFSVSADNPIDACVAMIEKLHELKML